MKKFGATYLALLVLVGLLGYNLYAARHAKPPADQPAATPLLTLDQQAIRGINVRSADGVASFVKNTGGAWQLTFIPSAAARPALRLPVDGYRTDGMAWALADLSYRRKVDERPAGLAPYGLDRPRAVVEVWLAGQAAKKVVLIGGSTPVPGSAYVRVEGDPAVYITDESQLTDFLARPVDQMKRNVIDFSPGDAVKITAERGGRKVEISKEGNQWRLGDRQLKADQVDDLLQTLQSFRAADLPQPAAGAATAAGGTSAGLGQQVWRISVSVKDQSKDQSSGQAAPLSVLELTVGTAGGDQVWVQPQGSDLLYPVAAADVRQVEQKLSALAGP